jgi:hypothetical protein
MKMPWHDQTGLAKAAALLATIFVIGIGLCGANFVAVIALVPMGGPSGPMGFRAWVSGTLSITAYLELAAIVLSALGLVVVGLIAIARGIKDHFTHN